MKRGITLTLILIGTFSFVISSPADNFRIFTGRNGRTVKAEITKCDLNAGRVLLLREGGRSVWAEIDTFSETDQQFIYQVAVFLDPQKLSLEITPHEKPWRDDKDMEGRKSQTTFYTIKITNHSDIEIPGLNLYYCMFRNHNGENRVYAAQLIEVGMLKSHSVHHARTEGRASYSMPSEKHLSKHVGACFRLCMATNENGGLCREMRHPSGISESKYAWKDSIKPSKASESSTK